MAESEKGVVSSTRYRPSRDSGRNSEDLHDVHGDDKIIDNNGIIVFSTNLIDSASLHLMNSNIAACPEDKDMSITQEE